MGSRKNTGHHSGKAGSASGEVRKHRGEGLSEEGCTSTEATKTGRALLGSSAHTTVFGGGLLWNANVKRSTTRREVQKEREFVSSLIYFQLKLLSLCFLKASKVALCPEYLLYSVTGFLKACGRD